MRLHHLRIEAFGPFAARAELDFEELNEAGVFLLSGPTGAGKTTLLDAACFALYGVVPGVRDVRSLPSHHAPASVRPEVELEATIAGRRFRVRRSPEWHRPKRRGVGTTREPARASLVEVFEDGSERFVSGRAAEVGHTLGQALGMSSEQFMQVVLLPQGDFQRFLLASSDARQVVLQRLFRTHRFEQVEHWMREHTRELAAGAERAETRVARLLHAVARQAGTPLPEGLDEDRLGDVAGLAGAWARRVAAAAAVVADRSRTTESEHDAECDLAVTALAEARRADAAARRRCAAHDQLRALDAEDRAAVDDTRRWEAHQRALAVAPHLDARQSFLERLAEARLASVEMCSRLAALAGSGVEGAGPTECRRIREEAVHRLADVRAAMPQQRACEQCEDALTLARQERSRVGEDLAAVSVQAQAMPEWLREVEDQLARDRASAATRTNAEDALRRAIHRRQAAQTLPSARADHQQVVHQAQDARQRAADARERHLDLVARRLAGMAAELAGSLVAGLPCAVCGSREHPAPAEATPESVTDEVQREAAEEHERLRSLAEDLAVGVERSRAALDALAETAEGLTPDEAIAGEAEAAATADRAGAAATGLPAVERRLQSLRDDLAELEQRRGALDSCRQRLDAEMAELQSSMDRLHSAVASVLGDDAGSLDDLAAALETRMAVCDEAIRALDECDRLESGLLEADDAATTAARAAGFSSWAAADQARLTGQAARDLRARSEDRSHRRVAAQAVLEDPEVRRLGDADPPDVAVLEERTRTARARLAASTRASACDVATASALAALVEDLDEALAVWEPLRSRHETAAGITRLVRGTSADNQLQMRLSSYVVATRLDQVLDAANERLADMRDQRYTLRRCPTARGGARAGLGLEVLDAWTGQARPPTTLSGGETFLVSLALALGLADVVSHESGGLRLDTLVVDEGFGMLDPETLDDVMDSIDALRAGGRTVGVVSHVTELRARIPSQVHVSRGRTGSTVAVRTLIA